jgi:transcriptional regulator with XRE-family HTH domain
MMPRRKSADPAVQWLSSVLALRLRQIERNFPTYSAFVTKAGISPKTLGLLRDGKGNPSFKTLLTLAESFEISVWSLLGIRDETARLGAESFGVSAEDVQDLVSPGHLDGPDDSGDPGE